MVRLGGGGKGGAGEGGGQGSTVSHCGAASQVGDLAFYTALQTFLKVTRSFV